MFLGANPYAFICLLAVGFVIEDISSTFHYSRTVWYYHKPGTAQYQLGHIKKYCPGWVIIP